MDILQWLQTNGSYADGLQLYHTYKRTKQYDNFFNQVKDAPKNSMHYRMLNERLSRIARIMQQNGTLKKEVKPVFNDKKPLSVTKIQFNKTGSVRVDDNPIVRIELLPDDLKEKFNENKKLVAEMSRLKSKLSNSELKNNERKEILDNLISFEQKKKNNWSDIDDWAANNPTALVSDQKPLTKVDKLVLLQKQAGNIKANISKTKQKLKNPKNETFKNKYSKKLKDWETDLATIEKEIKELTNEAK